MKKFFYEYGLYLAWLFASVAILGSFYWSALLQMEPCSLCWYQRLCFFPLAVILGIAAYRQDRRVIIYAAPFAVLGLAIALNHLMLAKFDLPFLVRSCTGRVRCAEDLVTYFGFLTPPLLSALAFLLILICLFAARKKTT